MGAGEGGLTVEAATSEPAVAPRRRRLLRLTTPALLGLPVSWLLVFFLVPIAIVAAYSVDVLVLFPGPHGFTISAWRSLFSGTPYLHLFAKSVELSLIVSARLHRNVLAIALANKLARIAWGVLAGSRAFEASKLQAA